jgi:hypothetical protein
VQTEHVGAVPFRWDLCSLHNLAPMTAGGRIPLLGCQVKHHFPSFVPMPKHPCQPQLWSYPQLRSEPNHLFDRETGINQIRMAARQVYQLMFSPQGFARCTSGTMIPHMLHYNCGDLRIKAETEVRTLKRTVAQRLVHVAIET